MKNWIEKQIAQGFRDLDGLSISGHIPVKDRLLNEALTEALRPGPGSSGSGPDLKPFLRFIKKAEIHSTEGALIIDFEVRVAADGQT